MSGSATAPSLRPRSLVDSGPNSFALSEDWRLVATGPGLEAFEGERSTREGNPLVVGPPSASNLELLRARLPWLRPRLLGIGLSAGFGDRLGLATPGHIAALRSSGRGIAPIFAQQSMREMSRSRRSPQEVMDDATWGVFAESWRDGFGADADHLKTEADVDACAAAGYTFYTIDPGAHVWPDADTAPQRAVREAFEKLPWYALEDSPSALAVRHGMDAEPIQRAAAKLGRAVVQVAFLDRRIRQRRGPDYELEVSVDETDTATTPEQHQYFVTELQRLGVRIVSLAPRFPGRFEKGVDFIGDRDSFEVEFARHMEIARRLGPYKLSLHSGSDKFSIYPAAARLSDGLVHLKTAGTSWLEALRTIGAVDPEFLAEMYAYGRGQYEADRVSYHVSAEVGTSPPVADLSHDGCRQILHVTFGTVLERFGDRLLAALRANRELYEATIQSHFERHLAPFQAK